MATLNTVPRVGIWSDSVITLNGNFSSLASYLVSVNAEIEKGKGLFQTLAELKATYPDPGEGAWAYVGTSFPARIYVFTSGNWVATSFYSGDPSTDMTDLIRTQEINGSGAAMFTTTTSWRYKRTEDSSWKSPSGNNNRMAIGNSGTTYTLYLAGLNFGGTSLLTGSGTSISFRPIASLSSIQLSSDYNKTATYTSGSPLYWDVNNTYFQNKDPKKNDLLHVTLRFNSPYGTVETVYKTFTFT